MKEFNISSIVKYLSNSALLTIAQFAPLIDQIINLHSFVLIKLMQLDKITGLTLSNQTDGVSFEDKTKILQLKSDLNEFIQSYGSNQKASPILLTWSTLLYNLSIDAEMSKIFTAEFRTLTNRMFSLSVKENVFGYLLDLLASEMFKNKDLTWFIKQVVYELLNGLFKSFDENSLGDNFKALYEITFYCMHQNEAICEHMWKLCNQPDRDNITILINYALETFPISFDLSMTFFSLIAKTSRELCRQVFEYMSRMDQYCEYLENLNPDDYIQGGDQVQLTRTRRIFDCVQLTNGLKGSLISHLATPNSNIAHRMILQNQAVNWSVTYSCFELIQVYLNKINYEINQNNTVAENYILSIIQFVDSLFKYFFDMEDMTNMYLFGTYTKHMESFVSSCFVLFTNLMNLESPESYRIISKLFELFTNIGPNVFDKLIRLMQNNGLIGLKTNKLSLEDLFTNRVNLVKSSNRIVYLFKSENYELIINYFKLIECLIKESGNNLEYISPLSAVLIYVFPQIFKWNNAFINLNIELSYTCLNLLHTVLNTSIEPSFSHTDFMRNFSKLHSER